MKFEQTKKYIIMNDKLTLLSNHKLDENLKVHTNHDKGDLPQVQDSSYLDQR